MGGTKEAVRSRYAGLAEQLAGPGDCCDPSAAGCGGDYSSADLDQLGLTGNISLGCGNPTMLADLKPGDVVLDLGSGGGLDVLLSARRVTPTGHAYGVDMTEEMLALANRNRERAGVENATFLRGSIENIPLPDSAVDVVISNCVINLAEDKGAVLKEAFRVLRSGGRLAVADMVEIETLAPEVKRAVDSWAGCISGTISVESYLALLLEAGFHDPNIEVHDTQTLPDQGGRIGSAYVRTHKVADVPCPR
ncbi:MAG: arsenite methyltransferase [Candidatus Dormibacteria bacterium]